MIKLALVTAGVVVGCFVLAALAAYVYLTVKSNR